MFEQRLAALRDLMAQQQIDFYYVPAADAHGNEYVPDCWQRRAWISGFTGSAGDVLVGRQQAYLWTDGRYFLQAEQELDGDCFQLMKQQQGVAPIHEWLQQQGEGLRVGVDPQLLTVAQQRLWSQALASSKSELVSIRDNWIDVLWQDQPALSAAPIACLDLRYTGQLASDKLSALREALKAQAADSLVITKLDAIAWLFNIRGEDIDYNPLVISYAIVTRSDATLFLDLQKVSAEDRHYFVSQGVALAAYNDFQSTLAQLAGSVWIDPRKTSWQTEDALRHAQTVLAPSPITLMKAIKNPVEQAGMREAHRIDGIAMVRFLHWLDGHWQQGVTEMSAAQQLEQYRREDPRCQDLSFTTISGFASNGAIIHYSVTEATSKVIDDSALYLVDSGGQYFEGTTDVTRTIHLGQPTPAEKRHYTLVLKGHIALRHACFPAGTCGEQVDILARQPLWQAGLDYGHGTGHGVGCYLCVHEGPQMISPRSSQVPLVPGMAVSNEPGVYFPGEYGIRIENVCLIQPVAKASRFYTLEDLTMVPYARQLIDLEILNPKEIQQIDDYHQMIWTSLSADLSPEPRKWLEKAINPLKS
jgi:Xaa-Pro aminopeptidase